MSGTRWHIPAIIVRETPRTHYVLTSACGKSGPMKVRDDLGHFPVDLFTPTQAQPTSLVCPECEVAWDKAEDEGRLLTVFVHNGKRAWSAKGAPVFLEPPTRHQQCWSCAGRREVPHQHDPSAGRGGRRGGGAGPARSLPRRRAAQGRPVRPRGDRRRGAGGGSGVKDPWSREEASRRAAAWALAERDDDGSSADAVVSRAEVE